MRQPRLRAPSKALSRKGIAAALVVGPAAIAAALLSAPSEETADAAPSAFVGTAQEGDTISIRQAETDAANNASRDFVAGLPLPPAPTVDLERSLPVGSYAGLNLLTTAVQRAEAAPAALSLMIEVAPGDTLMGLLTREGVERTDAHEAVVALEQVFSAKGLKPGQQILLTMSPGEQAWADFQPAAYIDATPQLISLALQPSVEQSVQVVRDWGGSFQAQTTDRPLLLDTIGQRGVIDDSLFASATANGVPVPVLIEMIRVFSYDVDFQREIQPGDAFEIVYDVYYDEAGAIAKTGDIDFVSLTLSGKEIALYHYTPSSGIDDFFTADGQSVRKALLRTPVDGARISSNFGMRKHPILGYSKMHKGVDFAVPTGTPIFAAGDGVVELAGWNGGYGNYIRLKHNGTYKTAYGHMSRIAKGMSKGTKVKQGDVIGYVGTTGQSTGPHLHYEVLISDKQVNPLDIKLPSGEKLAGKDLAAFKAYAAEIDKERRVKTAPLVAQTPGFDSARDAQ